MAKRKANEDAKAAAEAKQPSTMTEQKEKENSKTNESKLVERINSLAIEDFKARYVDGVTTVSFHATKLGAEFHFDLKDASGLEANEMDACFQLIQDSSRPDYEASSWGWHPKRKKKEMREPEMRYLLIRREGDPSGTIEGFLSFMITHDSTPSVPVLYVYEIHLALSVRGIGLGGHLMRLAEDIANRTGVEKVMLTCFLSNSKAHSFYRKLGYQTDACSPQNRETRNKVIKVDYEIMSKSMWEDDK